MDPISQNIPQFGEILEHGKQATVNAVKTAVSDTANTVAGQIGIKNEHNVNASANPQNQNSPTEPSTVNVGDLNLANEQTSEMVKDYYAPSTTSAQTQRPQSQEEQETQAKLAKLRQELHQQVYLDPLFAYEHKKQEKPAEVEEKKEQIKMAELEEKEKNKLPPIAVQRAQTSVEVNRGISG